MRAHLDLDRLQAFIEGVGRSAQSPGRIYLAGGATALLLGLRQQTIDIDIKLDPEPEGVFEAIATLKNRLLVNVELAAPDDFLVPTQDEQIPFEVLYNSDSGLQVEKPHTVVLQSEREWKAHFTKYVTASRYVPGFGLKQDIPEPRVNFKTHEAFAFHLGMASSGGRPPLKIQSIVQRGNVRYLEFQHVEWPPGRSHYVTTVMTYRYVIVKVPKSSATYVVGKPAG